MVTRGKRNEPKTPFRELQSAKSKAHGNFIKFILWPQSLLAFFPAPSLIPFSMESDAVTMSNSDITNNRVIKVSLMEKYMATPVV